MVVLLVPFWLHKWFVVLHLGVVTLLDLLCASSDSQRIQQEGKHGSKPNYWSARDAHRLYQVNFIYFTCSYIWFMYGKKFLTVTQAERGFVSVLDTVVYESGMRQISCKRSCLRVRIHASVGLHLQVIIYGVYTCRLRNIT